MSLTQMFMQSGWVAKTVIFVLFIMSIYSIAIMFEKFTNYKAARKESLEFLPAAARCLKANKLQEAVDISTRYKKAHIAKVMHSGLLEIMNQKNPSGKSDGTDAIQRSLDMACALTAAEMKKGLGGLATIGSTAPFIGLFGTVMGIVNAFSGMAATGSGGIAAVSAGIAEALITTAFGLLVAIPAVMAFNHFTNKLERFQIEMTNSSAELIDFYLKNQGESRAA
jgi:biopolymer transport protein ExbB/biopolymer transport protein TolQ